MSDQNQTDIKEKKEWTPPTLTVLEVEQTMGTNFPGGGPDVPYS